LTNKKQADGEINYIGRDIPLISYLL